MGLGNTEVRQEQSDGLASHRAATVGVKGELVVFNVLLAQLSVMRRWASAALSR